MEEIAAQFHVVRDTLERTSLPEPFLWHVFECLATAGRLMEQPSNEDNWQSILHLDYKPKNIFLGPPSQSRYHGYPTAKTGDFRLAKIVPLDDRLSARQYPACGTAYCKAREQTWADKTERKKMDSKTNVWSVGIVMWSLIELESGDHRLDYDPFIDPLTGTKNHGDPELLLEPRFRKQSQQCYSAALLDLISHCLQLSQEDRPTFVEVLDRIQSHVDQKESSTNGLKLAEKDDARWFQSENKLEYKSDHFMGYVDQLARPPNEMSAFRSPHPRGDRNALECIPDAAMPIASEAGGVLREIL